MAQIVAHDIKNPLTPIKLQAEHLRRVNAGQGGPLSPVLETCVDTILDKVEELRRLSVEFTSLGSSPTPRLEPVDLSRLLADVVAPYRAATPGQSPVQVVVEVAAPLPSAWLDATLFARALTNVVENALHAMPSGGTLTVAARAQEAARTITIDVTDTGVGMDEQAVARIFEPYFSTKASGTGLGLTIARRNVESSGGRISLRSVRGIGTTVTLTVPAVPGQTRQA